MHANGSQEIEASSHWLTGQIRDFVPGALHTSKPFSLSSDLKESSGWEKSQPSFAGGPGDTPKLFLQRLPSTLKVPAPALGRTPCPDNCSDVSACVSPPLSFQNVWIIQPLGGE